jgi:steroid delta-isomerase-like uncharacterized protein
METKVRPTEVATHWIDCWSRHDTADIAACLTKGGSYTDPASGGPIAGQQLRDYAQVYFTASPDIVFDILEVVDGGNGVVAVEWLGRGTFTGPLGEVQPNGRAFTVPGCDVLTIEGDAIRSAHVFWDQLNFQRQLGLAG